MDNTSFPRDERTTILDTDAEEVRIGGVHLQMQDGKEHVVAYVSRSLNKSARKYYVIKNSWRFCGLFPILPAWTTVSASFGSPGKKGLFSLTETKGTMDIDLIYT